MPDPRAFPVVMLIAMLVALGPISTDLYLPSLPAIGVDLNAGVGEVQLTLSVFLVAFGVSQLFYGPLSDRFGRRPALLLGVALYTVGSIACMLADSIETLVAARFVQAIGGCAGPVLGRAVVRDVFGRLEAAKVLSYIGTAMALAPAIGPILGGYLQIAFGWRANFALLSAFGLAALIGVVLMLRETNDQRDPAALSPRRIFGNFRDFLHDADYLRFLLAGAAVYSGLFAFISGSSFVFIDLIGLRPDVYGYCYAAVVVGYMAGTQIGGRLVGRFGIERMALAGALVCAASGLAMLAFALWAVLSTPGVLVPMIGYMVGLGMVLPNAMAGALGPFPDRAGSASSLFGFTQFGLAAAVGVGVGASFDGTALPMAAAIAACGVATPLACLLPHSTAKPVKDSRNL